MAAAWTWSIDFGLSAVCRLGSAPRFTAGPNRCFIISGNQAVLTWAVDPDAIFVEQVNENPGEDAVTTGLFEANGGLWQRNSLTE